MPAWAEAGLPTQETPLSGIESLREYQQQTPEALIVDVRQHGEFQSGHISGALNIELGELTEHLDGLPRELPIVVLCASGMRATIAGSILQRDNRDNIKVLADSGTADWISQGYPTATGDE